MNWKPRHANCKGPQPKWMLTLKVGEVIARPNGAWRIVRDLSRYANGELRSVCLVIRRCSWTRRCYTYLNANDLRTFGYRRVPGEGAAARDAAGPQDSRSDSGRGVAAATADLLRC